MIEERRGHIKEKANGDVMGFLQGKSKKLNSYLLFLFFVKKLVVFSVVCQFWNCSPKADYTLCTDINKWLTPITWGPRNVQCRYVGWPCTGTSHLKGRFPTLWPLYGVPFHAHEVCV